MALTPGSQDLATLLAGRGPEPHMQKQLEAGIDFERRRLGERPYLLMTWSEIYDYDGLSNSVALVDSFESATAAILAAVEQSALWLRQRLASPQGSHQRPWRVREDSYWAAKHLFELSPPEPIKTVHNQVFALYGGDYDRWYESFIVLGPFRSGPMSRELASTLPRFELWAYLTDIGVGIVPYIPPQLSAPELERRRAMALQMGQELVDNLNRNVMRDHPDPSAPAIKPS
jgi:hypothetical protein